MRSAVLGLPGADWVVIELGIECNDLIRRSKDLLPIVWDKAHIVKGIRERLLPNGGWSRVPGVSTLR